MKKVLLTGGPTNEYIDEVMKITNMSTGSLTLSLAERALKKGDKVTVVVTNSVLLSAAYKKIEGNPNLTVIPIETTQDMYNALAGEAGKNYDTVIHASAVGDYKPEYTFKMENFAQAIAEAVTDKYQLVSQPQCKSSETTPATTPKQNYEAEDIKNELYEMIMNMVKAGEFKVDNSSKISSYEPNLTVKLTLTTKIIANLKNWFPNATLIGCKLLENVTKNHLIEVATKLCNKNNMDYIMANDLAMLRNGQPIRYLINKDGYTGIELNGEGPALLDYAEKEWF